MDKNNMKIIKKGIIPESNSSVLPISYRRYILTCPRCKCIFEDSSNEFQSGDRDMPEKYVNCPTCGHYVFKSNGRRIKSINTI